MALLAQYCGTSDVILMLGGTGGRLDVGTSGTNAIHPAAVGSLIVWASQMVDWYLGALIGTTGFGTSGAGTRAVPEIVVQVTAKLAASEVIKTLASGRLPNSSEWAKERYDEAIAMLEKMQHGDMPIFCVTTGEADLPRTTSLTFRVRAETVQLDGTNVVTLAYQKAIPGSEKVYSTHVTGGTVYTRGTAYEFFGWDVGTSPQNYGAIRPLGTWIPTNADVLIDYEVWSTHIFGNPADFKASASASGLRHNMQPTFTGELGGDLSGYR